MLDLVIEKLSPQLYLLGTIAGIFGVFYLTSCLLRSVGLFYMAKKQGISSRWMAFIPFARFYFQGKVSGPIKFRRNRIENPGFWLMLLPFAFFVLHSVIVMGALVSVISQTAKMEELGMSRPDSSFYITLAFFAAAFIISLIASITAMFSIKGLVNYQIHSRYINPSSSVLHMMIGLIIPFYQSIFFFSMRNKRLITVKKKHTAAPSYNLR